MGLANIAVEHGFFSISTTFFLIVVCMYTIRLQKVYDMRKERLTKPTPCRFHPETRARLLAVSKRFRLSPSDLVRQAVARQLDQWDKDGRIVLAPQKDS
jgi:hypothetical protein